MERLTGLDATFLYFETPTQHQHVCATIIMDPSTMPRGYDFATMKQTIADRLHTLPPFRRRLATVPFNLDHPVWVEDADFDLDYHVRRIACPAPGTDDQLAEIAGDIAGRQLDRSRPLWEWWVIEGLEHGHIAVVAKMHHCTVDGVSGANMMVHLLDLEPGLVKAQSGCDLCREPYTTHVVLTDGGVYDNMGLETVWKRYQTVLVSDAGGKMQPEPEPKGDWARHALRINEVIDNQVRSLRVRQVIGSFEAKERKGTYWSVRMNIAEYGLPDALLCPVEKTIVLAELKTRLKRLDAVIHFGGEQVGTVVSQAPGRAELDDRQRLDRRDAQMGQVGDAIDRVQKPGDAARAIVVRVG